MAYHALEVQVSLHENILHEYNYIILYTVLKIQGVAETDYPVKNDNKTKKKLNPVRTK